MANMNKTTIVLCAMIIILPVAWTKSWAEDHRKDDPSQTGTNLRATDRAREIEEIEDCTKGDLSQTEMNLCSIDDAKKNKQALDAVYEKLMKKISPEGREKLLAAQSAWIDYREKQCDFNTLGSVGGSVRPMVLSDCYAYLANQQTKILQQQLECEEGDLSCGHQ